MGEMMEHVLGEDENTVSCVSDDNYSTALAEPVLIPSRLHDRVRQLWPLFMRAVRRGEQANAKMLLSMAYVLSGLETVSGGTRDGRRGLFLMDATTAAWTARQLRVEAYDLDDPLIAIWFAARRFSTALRIFGSPTMAVNTFMTPPRNLNDWPPTAPSVWQSSSDASAYRTERDVMFVWRWTVHHLNDLLEHRAAGPRTYDNKKRVYAELPEASQGQLVVPVPGSTPANNGEYRRAQALDVVVPYGSPVVAVAGATVHSCGNGSLLLQLDAPFEYKGSHYGWAAYDNLSRLRYAQNGTAGLHVAQGELIGWSGTSGRMPCVSLSLRGERHGRPFLDPRTLAAYFGWTAR